MGCQREKQKITCLAVKENQGIRDLFEGAEALGFECTTTPSVNKGHGRVDPAGMRHHRDGLPDYINPHGQWPQLKAAIKVVGQ